MAKRYKWLADEKPVYGSGTYDLSGAWQAIEGPLALCKKGYHVCDREQVAHWRGTSLWEVEVDGECRRDGSKECWQRIRFVRQLKWTKRDMVECAVRDAAAAREADAARRKAAVVRVASWAAAAATNAADAAETAVYGASCAVAEAASWAANAATYAADAAIETAESQRQMAWIAERQRQTSWIERRLGETLG